MATPSPKGAAATSKASDSRNAAPKQDPDPVATASAADAGLRCSIASLALFSFATGVWAGASGMALWFAGRCRR
jgi:hypothetical protein